MCDRGVIYRSKRGHREETMEERGLSLSLIADRGKSYSGLKSWGTM